LPDDDRYGARDEDQEQADQRRPAL